jgi:hypothetical protein
MQKLYRANLASYAEDWAEATECSVQPRCTSPVGWSLGDITTSGTEVKAPSRLRRHTPKPLPQYVPPLPKPKEPPKPIHHTLTSAYNALNTLVSTQAAGFQSPRYNLRLQNDRITVFLGPYYEFIIDGKPCQSVDVVPDYTRTVQEDANDTFRNLLNISYFKS